MVEKRYSVLRAISFIYRLFAVIILVGAILMAVVSLLGMSASGISSSMRGSYGSSAGLFGLGAGLASFAVTLIGGGGAALSLYAIGEAIQLFIDMEENTRENNALLRALGRALTQDTLYPDE